MLKQNRVQNNTAAAARKGMTTRSQNQNFLLSNVLNKPNIIPRETRGKRKAEASPPKEKTAKRTAFANITNVSIYYVYNYLNITIIMFIIILTLSIIIHLSFP